MINSPKIYLFVGDERGFPNLAKLYLFPGLERVYPLSVKFFRLHAKSSPGPSWPCRAAIYVPRGGALRGEQPPGANMGPQAALRAPWGLYDTGHIYDYLDR
jgi:hypothetical protein